MNTLRFMMNRGQIGRKKGNEEGEKNEKNEKNMERKKEEEDELGKRRKGYTSCDVLKDKNKHRHQTMDNEGLGLKLSGNLICERRWARERGRGQEEGGEKVEGALEEHF